MRAQSSASDTSACTTSAAPPASSTNAAVSRAPSSLTSITAIDAPCVAKSNAAARPWPDAAPVMSATRPSSITLRSMQQHRQRRRGAESFAVDVRIVALDRFGIEAQVGETIEKRVDRPAHLHSREVHAETHVRADAE